MSYPLHPFSAHFPIALLLTASALELWSLRQNKQDLSMIVKILLQIGWWSSLITLITGLIDLVRQFGLVQKSLGWINSHVLLGLIVVFVYSRLTFRRLTVPERKRLHLLGGGLLLVTGLIGGHLVYSLGFGKA